MVSKSDMFRNLVCGDRFTIFSSLANLPHILFARQSEMDIFLISPTIIRALHVHLKFTTINHLILTISRVFLI